MDRIRRVRSVVREDEPEDQEPEIVSEETEDEANEVGVTVDDLDRIEQKYRDRATSPLKAIRAFCVLCMGCQPRMVATCTAKNCTLYPFRFGKNPFQKHTKSAKTRGPKT